MRLLVVLGITLVTIASLVLTDIARASSSVKIQPLLQRDNLAQGEKKKGYVDITNPSEQAITLSFSVQGFKQIDDQGNLQFFDDEQIEKGVLLDLKQAELEPKDVLRLYFVLDGTKLPQGDVFVAIMASTKAQPGAGMSSAVSARVGTLFVLTNGTPPSRNVKITDFSTPIVQLGDSVSAQLTIRNTDPVDATTGFFPEVELAVWPYINQKVEGPLVFAGRSRQLTINQTGDYFGIIKFEASTGSSNASSYSLVITGFYRWLIPSVALALLVIGVVVSQIKRLRNLKISQ